MSYEPEDEMVRVVSRMCGIAIALLIIIPIFTHILGLGLTDFFKPLIHETIVAAAAR